MHHQGLRVDFGSAGEKYEVLTNSFQLVNIPKLIFQYKIEISSASSERSEGKKRQIGRKEYKAIWHALKAIPPFDQPLWVVSENDEFFWAVRDLKVDSKDVRYYTTPQIHYKRPNGEDAAVDCIRLTQDMKIEFTGNTEDLVGTHIFTDRAATLNVFLSRYAFFSDELIQAGANRFFLKHSPTSMNQALEARLGYKLSTRAGGPQNCGLLANVNTTTSLFLKEIPIPVLLKALPDRESWNNIFYGVQVTANYGPQKKLRSITSFGRAANVESFSNPSGKVMTVEEYFKTSKLTYVYR